jgi:hypothetical protein
MQIEPKILAPDYGKHNEAMDQAIRRLETVGFYKDLSTIIIIPGFGSVPTRCAASWMDLMTPPNNKIYRMWTLGMEVGEAYSQSIRNILEHPDLSKFKYILTMEHDNAPQSDALVKLLIRMEEHSELSCISALYWTKGDGGVPQIWGDPNDYAPNYRPQLPRVGELVPCWGTGMGFALWRLEMFKDERLRRPWFKTACSTNEGVCTQDLYFWSDARKYGYKCAVDCGVLTVHFDLEGKFGPPDTMY